MQLSNQLNGLPLSTHASLFSDETILVQGAPSLNESSNFYLNVHVLGYLFNHPRAYMAFPIDLDTLVAQGVAAVGSHGPD